MLNRFWRTLTAILLVGATAGAAVAFSVGVHFAPRTTCVGSSLSYGSGCPSVSVHHVTTSGFAAIHRHRGRIHFRLTNHNKVKVTVTITLVMQTRSGKIHRIKRIFSLQPGKTYKIDLNLHFRYAVSAGRLKVQVRDANGDSASFTKQFGSFKKS
jgi:hypothetical protein